LTGGMIPNFLFVFLQDLVLDFAFLHVPEVLPDQIFCIGRILLDARPFPGKSLMIGAELDQDLFETVSFSSPAHQIPEPGVGEEIERSQSQADPEKNSPTIDRSLLKPRRQF
jgi:hypothetical protein